MIYISTDFGVDSASRFPFTARTHRQTDRQTESETQLTTVATHHPLPLDFDIDI